MSRLLVIGAAFTLGIMAAVILRSSGPDHGDIGRMFTGAASSPSASSPSAAPASGAPGVPAPAYSSLIPEDAFLFMELRSMNQVDTLVSAIQPEFSQISKMMFAAILSEVEGDVSALDPNKPIVFAISPADDGERGCMTAVLPVPAPTAFAQTLKLSERMSTPLVRPGYIGISEVPGYGVSERVAPILDGIRAGTTFLLRVRPASMGDSLDQAIARAGELSPASERSVRQAISSAHAFIEQVEELELSVEPTGEMHTISFGASLRADSEYRLQDPARPPATLAERVHELDVYADPRMVASLHLSWDAPTLVAFARQQLADVDSAGIAEQVEKWLPYLGGELLVNMDYGHGGPFLSLYSKPGLELQDQAFDKLRLMLPLLLTTSGLSIEGSERIELDKGKGLRLTCSNRLARTELEPDAEHPFRQQPLRARWDTGEFVVELLFRGGHMAVLMFGDDDRRANVRAWFGVELEDEGHRPSWIPESSHDALHMATSGDGNALQLALLELSMLRDGEDPEDAVTKLRRLTRGRRTPFYTQLSATGADLRFEYTVDFDKIIASQDAAARAMSFSPFR